MSFEKFKNEYWNSFLTLKEELKQNLYWIWFDTVKKEYKEVENYVSLKKYLEMRDKKEELKKYILEFNFREVFWKSFFKLKDELKIKLMNIWLEEVKNDVYWKYSIIYSRDRFEWYLKYKENESWMKEREKDILFINEYWNFYSNCKVKDSLKKLWFNIVKNEVENEYKDIFNKFWFKIYLNCRNLKNKFSWISLNEYTKFCNEFEYDFLNLKHDIQMRLLDIWFNKVSRDLKEKEYFKDIFYMNWFLWYLEFFWKEEQLINHLMILDFKREFWKDFMKLDDELKWKLLQIWFENIIIDISNNFYEIYKRYWLIWYLIKKEL